MFQMLRDAHEKLMKTKGPQPPQQPQGPKQPPQGPDEPPEDYPGPDGGDGPTGGGGGQGGGQGGQQGDGPQGDGPGHNQISDDFAAAWNEVLDKYDNDNFSAADLEKLESQIRLGILKNL